VIHVGDVAKATYLFITLIARRFTVTQAREQEYLAASAQIVGGLVELASTALLSKFPTLSVDETDIELLLDMLHLLRPAKAEIGALDGVLHMSRGHWSDAIRVLRDVSERAPRFGHARALLAYSLSMQDDPEWRRYADEALEISPGPDTQYLVSALVARADLAVALESAKRTGQFVVPESVTALSERNNSNAPAEATTSPSTTTTDNANAMPDFMMYGFQRA
jgi:type III secretion protein HrpB1